MQQTLFKFFYPRIKKQRGFTLIEMIMVIVLIGVMGTITTEILILPVNSYVAMARRTTLADNADMALRNMQADIRRALPNSVRVNASGTAIEMIPTIDGGRYRELKNPTLGDSLIFNKADTSFDVIGELSAVPSGSLVIYNLGSGLDNAYATAPANNRAAINNASSTTTHVAFTSKKFPSKSPAQRFYIVGEPVAYFCAGSTLQRFQNYGFTASISNFSTLAGGQLQANSVTNCSFTYVSGTSSRSGLASISITLTDAAGETVSLLHQVHVANLL